MSGEGIYIVSQTTAGADTKQARATNEISGSAARQRKLLTENAQQNQLTQNFKDEFPSLSRLSTCEWHNQYFIYRLQVVTWWRNLPPSVSEHNGKVNWRIAVTLQTFYIFNGTQTTTLKSQKCPN